MKDETASEVKKPKKTRKTEEKQINTSELQLSESTDLSSVFFSQYNTTELPAENKKSAGIIENFVILIKNSLSKFLGKKIHVQFNNMKVCELRELNLDKSNVILSSIQFNPQNQFGLLFFDYTFMHFIIDILYGAGSHKNNTIITSLGKSGIPIAEKVTSLCLAALQEAIFEYENIQISLIKTTEQRGLILNQPLSDQFFNLTFGVTLEDVPCTINIAIPDELFEEITYQEGVSPIENVSSNIVNDSLKKDIIESTVTLVATLQDIKLKINDIINLKSGDLIPIQDPTIVFMAHNQKKIFKGTVGQSNSMRVVKIVDNL